MRWKEGLEKTEMPENWRLKPQPRTQPRVPSKAAQTPQQRAQARPIESDSLPGSNHESSKHSIESHSAAN